MKYNCAMYFDRPRHAENEKGKKWRGDEI